jgi:hypothetical protein
LKFRRTLLAGVIVALVFAFVVLRAPRARAAARKPVTLEVVFHVASENGKPVADEAYIDERLAKANEIYAPYGVTFARNALRAAREDVPSIFEGADARDALAKGVERGVINCFVVRKFRDLGNDEWRRGVHWHSRTHRGVHYVILSRSKDLDVLAHELGHFLGNPQHSQVHGNLMSYDRGPELPVLDDKQRRNIDRALRGYFARREVRSFKASLAAVPEQAGRGP